MNTVEIILLSLVGLFVVYVLIRLMSKAVFRSYWEEKLNALIKSSFKKNK